MLRTRLRLLRIRSNRHATYIPGTMRLMTRFWPEVTHDLMLKRRLALLDFLNLRWFIPLWP